MKATARAHPIQGLIKYHGLRDEALNIPYHDSISMCTAPSKTETTVEFGYETDTCLVNGEPIDEEGADRVRTVLDRVRRRAGIDSGARVVSRNTFASNVGLGASASAFAALAVAAANAADLDLSRRELSVLARHGAPSAARSVTGGFSRLGASTTDEQCAGSRIDAGFDAEIRTVVGLVPEHKHTSHAHEQAPESHLFDSRLAYIHDALADMQAAISTGDFDAAFGLAEQDSISLLAVTMTGPENWFYWQPETVQLWNVATRLRADGVPVYFSADTGATAYLNTTSDHAERIAGEVESLGLESMVWRVGGPARCIDDHLF
ncbi:diphosphomevalonate decarboxylase [Haloarcula sp. S1AR25-5A]|uniref:Diphosphomevalonate decarboxylase n=1 Tax=Haloarcula terrestris TaxID=2950533 RepID=A0AAE4JFQ0_9EURY|nr:diphosphomevalonate decarboxylase [Haloarcula terrestris]MDS0220578.1 diphosphomevalonate decarboxylase [Haloarcula terrestris]